MDRIGAELDEGTRGSEEPWMAASQPIEIALFQPIEVIRELDPAIAGRLQDLWGNEALHAYVDGLTHRTGGVRRAPMDARLLNALLALVEHHASRLRSSEAPLGPITVWVLDRVRVNALLSPLLRRSGFASFSA